MLQFASALFLRYFYFAVDQLSGLLAECRKEVLITLQGFALVAGVLGDHIIGHTLSQENRCGEVTPIMDSRS